MSRPEPTPFRPAGKPQAPPVALPPPPAADFGAWREIEPASITPTRFVYGDTYAAGYLSVTLAAPKTGKSVLALAEVIDAASGRGFLTGQSADPLRVLYFNAEDDQNVLDARAIAAMQGQGIAQADMVGRLFLVSGVPADRQLVLIGGGKQATVNEPAFAYLTDMFRRENIALAVFDPLQDLSECEESNDVFRALGKRIRRMASETGVAVGLVHHTRKPSAGVQATIDDGRGGSALRGVARFNRLLVPMTEAEGAQSGVDDFRRYFRIAEAESNLAPPSSARNQWFEKVGMRIGNGGNYPTVKRWTWPNPFAGVTVSDACRVRAAIAARAADENPPRENSQAQDWAGHIVADLLGLDLSKRGDKARVVAMLKTWIETKVLAKETLPIGANRKPVPCLVAGPNNPAEVSP